MSEPSGLWADAVARVAAALGMTHRDGVPWWQAPVPRRWHRCRPQTTYRDGRRVDRCACGAVRLDGDGPWIERNTRSQ